MEKEIIKYNELPVISFRWLRANDISLEKYKEKNEFNREYIKSGKEFIKQHKSSKSLNIPEVFGVYEGSNKEEIAHILANAEIVNEIRTDGETADVNLEYKLDDSNLIEINLITAEEGQTINVVTDYKSDSAKISETLNILYAKKNSVINITRLNRLGFNTRNIDQRYTYVEDGAKVNYINVDLGASETVVHYLTELKGVEAEGTLKAIYIGNKNRLIDLSHNMHHYGKKTNSDMEIKGVMMDKAKKFFRGTLDFKKGSTASEGSEVETVLLLNEGVRNVSVPLLLCREDDVIGNHAASAGQIDGEKLFYLMSRGFSEDEAKRMVVESSFRPIIDLIKEEKIQEEILNSVHETMEKAEGK